MNPPAGQRIESIDATRGVTLFLILFSHCVQSFFATHSYVGTGAADVWCMKFFDLFVFHKSMMLFALLFGLSFFFQMQKAAQQGGGSASRQFAVRLGWLAVFGYVNGVFDRTDMLLPFALCGAVLLPFRRAPLYVLIVAALFLLCKPPLILSRLLDVQDHFHHFFLAHKPPAPDTQTTGWVDFAAWNLWPRIPSRMCIMCLNYRIFDVPGMFLLGCCIGKWRILEPQNTRRLARVCLPAAVLLALAYAIRRYVHVPGGLFPILQSYVDVLQTLFYALFFTFLFRLRAMAWLCHPMAAIGKSTLSCYMSQGVILSFLMFGWGLGWAETMPASQKAVLAVVLFLLQMLFCVLWLKRWRLCPMEALWRHLVSRSVNASGRTG